MRFVLLGDPVEHSRSPAIHNAAFDHLGLAGSYGLRRCDAVGVYEAVGEMRSGELAGANVTMPHKAVAARAVDALSERADRLGAVNTLVFDDGTVVGYNTDVDGVRYSMNSIAHGPETTFLVLGAGGAAAAAVAACEGHPTLVSARRTDAAEDLAARLGGSVRVVPWGEPLNEAIVINATPLGVVSEPLPVDVVEASSAVIDLAYGSDPRHLSEITDDLGLPYVDGLTMLVGQAAAAFELWTGEAAPLDVMERAARHTG